MKYSEAKKQIGALSSEYRIDMGDGDFNVVYKSTQGTFVDGTYRYEMCVGNRKAFSKLPFSDKLYMILSELAMTPLDKRVEERKRYVKIFDGPLGYLNISTITGEMRVYDKCETYLFKTKFTNKDIEELKQRDDVPVDWNKVHFEDAE